MMKVQRVSTDGFGSRGRSLIASTLPPEIVERAVNGLCWISLFTAVTTVLLTLIDHVLQPEFAAVWAHPLLRITTLGILFVSIGFIAIQRAGILSKQRLLDLGLVYQVAIAFGCALFEAAAYKDPNMVVIGHSAIGVWMMMCGLLMPKAPLRAAISGALCVLAWPAGYWVDLHVFGYQPMPVSRLLVWVLPLTIVAVWMYILNNRVLKTYSDQQQVEDIGSYVLDYRLGYGGMGEVWRARHKMLARPAAIKLIRPEVLQSSSGRQANLLKKRFEREAQATASLRSPHTVALYDFGESKEGSFYYVMELLEGIDLQSLVDQYGPMDPGRVVHILEQVTKSLEEAHTAGLIHRDIKPRNILLCKSGLEYDFAKVLDFGLVKSLYPSERDDSMLTVDGVTTGTPAFLPPEVAMGRSDVDGRADLYSLGCVAYLLLTGRMVFEEPTPTAFAIAHAQTPPPPMSMRTELPVPGELEALVMEMLEKDPARRPRSAHELGRRLRALSGVPRWCPERAAGWWETNLPDLPAHRTPHDDGSSGAGTTLIPARTGARA